MDVQSKIRRPRPAAARMDPPTSKSNPEDGRSCGRGRQPAADLRGRLHPHVIRPQLQTISGVGEIQMSGFRDRSVRVWYDAVRLEAKGLTVEDVNNAIQREHLEVPAGRIESAAREMNVRAEGEAIDLEGFRQLVLAYRDGAPVRLTDVAVVEDGLEDRRRVYRAMGEPAIGFGITKLRGANAVQVGRDVRARVAEIEKQLPEGLFIVNNFDTTVFIERAIEEIRSRCSRRCSRARVLDLPRLVVDDAQRAARDPDIDPRHLHRDVRVHFTLNTYTVLGLTLVVGIVVDDAIMVLRTSTATASRARASQGGSGRREGDHLRAAAATAAIIAIFLPVAFM
jgi:multidrug efflux pump subunit AcrB